MRDFRGGVEDGATDNIMDIGIEDTIYDLPWRAHCVQMFLAVLVYWLCVIYMMIITMQRDRLHAAWQRGYRKVMTWKISLHRSVQLITRIHYSTIHQHVQLDDA